MTTLAARPSTPRPLRGYRDRRTYTGTLHLFADLALGTAYFTVLTTMLALSLGFAITLVGLPLLAVTLLLARGIGRLERGRAALLLESSIAAPDHRTSPWWRRLVDGPDWRASIYGLVLLPWSLVTGGLALLGWACAAAALAFPLYSVHLSDPSLDLGIVEIGGPAAAVGAVAVGALLLAVMPRLVAVLADLDRWLVRTLLGARQTGATSA